jgi:hypothetical protein
MTLEIISASSVEKDTDILRNDYWRARISEYWLVDARGDTPRFDILRYTQRGYVPTRKQGGWVKFQLHEQSGQGCPSADFIARLVSEQMPREPRRTLDELEGVEWGPPNYPTYLVQECHRLRKKPVNEFTVEDLRIMIGQKIGLDHLMPRAVEALEHQPLAEGRYYPGDLLGSVLNASDWLRHRPEMRSRVARIVKRACAEIRASSIELSDDFKEKLEQEFSEFLRCRLDG